MIIQKRAKYKPTIEKLCLYWMDWFEHRRVSISINLKFIATTDEMQANGEIVDVKYLLPETMLKLVMIEDAQGIWLDDMPKSEVELYLFSFLKHWKLLVRKHPAHVCEVIMPIENSEPKETLK